MFCASAASRCFLDEMTAKADVLANRHDTGHVGLRQIAVVGMPTGTRCDAILRIRHLAALA